jgi:hypothetical protein
VDFNAWIARYNVEHCREVTGHGVQLDLVYFREMGPSAIPALDWYARHRLTHNAESVYLAGYLTGLRIYLTNELTRNTDDWRGWTWQKSTLSHYLAEHPGAEPQ